MAHLHLAPLTGADDRFIFWSKRAWMDSLNPLLKILVQYGKLNIDLVTIKSGLATEEAIKLHQEDPAVAYAEPNYTRSVQPRESGDTH
jgi:hypothetical protein